MDKCDDIVKQANKALKGTVILNAIPNNRLGTNNWYVNVQDQDGRVTASFWKYHAETPAGFNNILHFMGGVYALAYST